MATVKYGDCELLCNRFVREGRDAFLSAQRYDPFMAERKRFFLREWRKYMGLTQEVLGERVGTSKGHISDIERGEAPWNERWLERFAEALGIDTDQLLNHLPPVISEEDASWGESPAGEPPPPLDRHLMAECIRNAVKLVAKRALRRPEDIDRAADDAAAAALDAYRTYFRLKDEEAA